MNTETTHDYKVGDILASSWGYDQMNIDFYQVTGVTPKSVRIRAIAKKVTESEPGSMEGVAVPLKDAFIDTCDIKGEKLRKVDSYGYINITSCTWAKGWSGVPKRCSWYV